MFAPTGEMPSKHVPEVEENHTWTITFNQSLDPATANEASVYVTDYRGEPLDTDINLGALDQTTIHVSAPAEGYSLGAHTLFITSDHTSGNGHRLEEQVKHLFKVPESR
ncbi:hypothetical protein B0H94_10426 [Salsuginibacillus halophilus]|uniref:SbsA Ig-like domain-containing protein n=1 Tax=Salsuginibacillus halophilus TaxID=517424 RepID=A0A2P8HQD4_9BACI|nr:hypothetical protein [Salsuginibacillus halophilus]PSL48426.1 hypothetical protein B0H94_10426 [Salsuginibacillus halophilus]